MKDVVVASACRTAIGTFGGSLRDSHAAMIAAVGAFRHRQLGESHSLALKPDPGLGFG